jgi:hypothetical protein
MAITAAYESSASIGTTEYSLPNASTTLTPITADGIYQLFLDLNAMAAGDQYELKLYEKVQSAGTQRVVERWTFDGAQGTPHWVSPTFILMHGWDMTLDKISGTDRTIGWSIRQVA